MIKPGESPASSWEEKYKKEHKLRQEAEGETTIVKGIGQNSPEMKAAKAEIENLKETLKSRDYTRQHDYQFLIDENRRLEEERNMLILDNKRLAHQIDNQVDRLRKAGAL